MADVKSLADLVQAAHEGHGDVLRSLLHQINSSDPTPSPDQPELSKALSSALLGATEQGHSDCLSALLDSGASFLNIDGLIDATNEHGDTALMVAAKDGRGDCAKILLQHNPEAQVAAANDDGDTALILAARRGCAELVNLLLQHNPGAQVTAANATGETALISAAYGGHAACISQLLQHSPEAQVVAIDSMGRAALVAAVSENHPDCVALLLAHSPSTQIAAAEDAAEQPVVQIAARLGHPHCLDLILAHDPQPQYLDAAWLSALRQWDATHARTSPHTQCLERLHAKGGLLPASAQEADKAKNRLFIQEFAKALTAERTNEAIVGLALSVRSKKRKAGQGEQLEEQEGA